MGSSSLMWFRKGLRLHDNPALEHAAKGTDFVYPVFVIDPHYMDPDPAAFSPGSARAGVNRIRFLLESLSDLDSNLRKLGSRLLILKGEPGEVLVRCLEQWDIKKLCFEYDTDPYYQALDARVQKYVSSMGIEVYSPVSHTLFDPRAIIEKNGGKPPLTYQSFVKLAGQPSWASSPVSTGLSSIPPLGDVGAVHISSVPTIEELGYENIGQIVLQHEFSPFKGGESEALKRLERSCDDKGWVAKFEKPKGDPSSFEKPATTVLSPYLKVSDMLTIASASVCLFVLTDYATSKEVCSVAQTFSLYLNFQIYIVLCLRSLVVYLSVYRNVKHHTSPPVSLLGQLLWRDFFYTAAFGTPNFDKMKGNRICKQIPWDDNSELLAAWRDGRTGYPWIDAIMVQAVSESYESNHMSCSFINGAGCTILLGIVLPVSLLVFIHWEKGRDVFERLLIDSDWAINNGNWLWLSCSSFFYDYNRIYSPISFGKKHDPNGNFIRHFLPVLKDIPKEYIYEPWTAPKSIQIKAKCIIGKDYPSPVVAHDSASKECKKKLAEAYALNRKLNGAVNEDDLRNLKRKLEEDQNQEGTERSQKQKLIR
ncbi:hypothetical protein Cgig2_012458 [Carnegiea gigantea]|uniref:Photolyase/cryptochrome alpha/beta domain-containing protein n=1 Tax=Carnegiea gigantea TaxID=171969 RepID=A0A9Q1KMB4_9CARY|nr:hypothetical protein Cgig2_012458 [Carnegiea gigantea]